MATKITIYRNKEKSDEQLTISGLTLPELGKLAENTVIIDNNSRISVDTEGFISSGTVTWLPDGTITGGSGVLFYWKGIYGVAAGVTTFSLEASTGLLTAVNANISGTITATLGAIGGWVIGATTLTGTGVTLSSTGDAYIAFGITPPTGVATGTGIFINKTGLYGLDTNVQKFKISAVDGSITSILGYIGGWTIGATTLSAVAGGNTTILSSGATAFSAGPTGAPTITITQAGVLNATGVIISGTITASAGTIGGFTISATALYAGTGATRIQLDTTSGVHLGATAFANAPFSVTLAGVIYAISGTIGGCLLAATSIGSTTFLSGPLGYGWNVSNTGTAEFQDITVRGIIRTSVFEKDTISAVNGIVLVSKADILASDMTALDSSTVVITGETTFVNNEVIRIKDGTDDEWMLVTDASGAPTYVVTRDLAASYGANANPTWRKGTAVVSMGVGTGNKTGFVLLDSSSANSPYFDVYGRNSNTYTDYTLHARLGWLKGITDADVGLAGTDTWGLYTDNAYIKGVIVANSGLIGGFDIGADYIRDIANSFGLASTVTGGDDIRFWAGATFANRATAPLRISEAGVIVATSGYFGGTTNGIQINTAGLQIIGTGYIATDVSPNARVQMIADSGGGFTDNLEAYDASNDLIFRLTIGGGWPCFTIFSRATTGGAQIVGQNSAGTGTQLYVKGIGVEDVIVFESNGTTARTGLSLLRMNLYSDTGDGLYIIKDSAATGANIKLKSNTIKGSNLIEVEATSWTGVHPARITSENYIQLPAYYHCSEFDELIADGTALNSSVIGKAYWVGSGTSGTQTFSTDSNRDRNTYLLMSTTSTASRTSIITFGRYIEFMIPEVEFRLRFNNITNCTYKFGFQYDATHFIYFRFDTALHATKLYLATNSENTDLGVALNNSAWHTFRLKLYPGGLAKAWVDDAEYSTTGATVPSDSMKPYIYIDNKAASEEKICYVDYVKVWKGRDDSSAV